MKEIKEFAAVVAEETIIDPIHDWVFHFNTYTNEWNAIHREVYDKYWNGYTKGVAKHDNIDILISLIRSGDINYKV